MPDYTLYSGVHVCWSEHSDLPFVYGFMSLDYGLGTMTTTTTYNQGTVSAIKFRKVSKFKITIALPKKFRFKGFITAVKATKV